MNKPVRVSFINKKVELEFEELKYKKFEDKQLHDIIFEVMQILKINSTYGIKLPKRLWPKEYIQNYYITNLWKVNLPNGWRLVYTIDTTETEIVNKVLEWFTHKEYERRFGY
mgnify:FL=1